MQQSSNRMGQSAAAYDGDERRATKRITKMQRTEQAAMKACAGMAYTGPVIITHKLEKNGNNCVITNETHCKSTNNGFQRGVLGGFYCH